jgi:hypothetical protein
MWQLKVLPATLLFLSVPASTIRLQAQSGRAPFPQGNVPGAPQGLPVLIRGPRTPVNPPDVGYHGEVIVVADPESADNLMVCGYRTNPRTGAGYEGYVYRSDDEGRTWAETLVDSQSQWVSEESCAFGPNHQAYFASGVSDTSRGEPHHEYGTLHLYRSLDGGRAWQTLLINRFIDYTSMAIDSTDSPGRGTLYLFGNTVVDGTTGGWQMMDRTPYLATFRQSPALNFSLTSGSFNSHQSGPRIPGMYPATSALLSDGTVLALFPSDGEVDDSASSENARLFAVDLGVSRDGGKSLQKSTVYQSADPAVATGLAVNRATDQVYVCWTPRYGANMGSRLMLASSTDRAKSWSVKAVKVPNDGALDLRVGSVSLAISEGGVLGFMWYGENADRVYFGASFDGGDSIASVLSLTPDPPTVPTGDQLQADERRLFVYPPVWKDSSHQLDPLRILLFGPDPWGVPFGSALVADKNGIFHPIWSEVANGVTSLWTRTISLQVPHKTLFSLTTDGLSDLSDKLIWHVSNIRYDHLSHLVIFDITITNQSEEDIVEPVLLELGKPSGQPELSADNADNGLLGEGALWRLRVPLDGLWREHNSATRTLSFRTSTKTEDIARENKLINVALRVYGKLSSK